MVGLTINGAPALVHGTGVQVVIPALAILGVPAFDHSTVGVIPHPLAAVGILVYFLAYGFGTLLHAVQPVPGTAGGVIDLFAAVVGVAGLPALAHPVFVPVALAINRVPEVARRAAGHFAVNGVEVVQLVVYRNGTILHNTGLGVVVHLAAIRQGPGAFDHGTGDRLKIVPLAVLAVLTFYHVAVGIIAHPFAAVGFLINVFIHGLGTALVGIQPVPGVAAGIVNFLAAACGALLYAVLIPANDIFAIGEGVRKVYEEVLVPAGMGDVALYTEMGRFMLAPYGCLVTTAIHEKHTYKEYIGVDACAVNLMRPAMYGAYHHITVMGKENEPCDHKYDVTGSLCENNDKFAIDRMLPKIDMGDILVIHDTGAHGFSMGYNYNGKLRSAELLLKEDGSVEMIRRAETPKDYFATFDFCDLFKNI